jgi:hypothetical protein
MLRQGTKGSFRESPAKQADAATAGARPIRGADLPRPKFRQVCRDGRSARAALWAAPVHDHGSEARILADMRRLLELRTRA